MALKKKKKKRPSGWTAAILHAPGIIVIFVLVQLLYVWLFACTTHLEGGVSARKERHFCYATAAQGTWLRTLNCRVQILPLLFSCSPVCDIAKTNFLTDCKSPLQMDRDHHLNPTVGISASEWEFQSQEDILNISLLLWLVKRAVRSYSKYQIDRYMKIAGIRSDFLLLLLTLSTSLLLQKLNT